MSIEDRLREALRRRGGDGALPDAFVARVIRGLPARESRWSTWLRPARGLLSAVTLVVVVALLLAVARPDLLGGNPGPSAIRSPTSTVRGSSVALGTSPTPSPAGPTMTPNPTPTGPSSARYDDGIPRAFDGQPVLRGSVAVTEARSARDATSFLVGGWVSAFPPGQAFSCPAFSNMTWLNDCPPTTLYDVAGDITATLAVPMTFHFVLGQARTGPVVVSVHVHDPRASECGAQAPACAKAMVVDRIVWTGDGATEARPLAIAAMRQIVMVLQPTIVLADDEGSIGGCDQPPSSVFYVARGAPPTGPSILSVAIEPSAAARQRALSQSSGAAAALASGWRPHGPICGESGTGAAGKTTWVVYRALAVANVVISVQTSITLTAADRSFVERLASALERAAGGS
ncbi:MAG: hypothetical protein ACRDGL_10620 [Candidatus Limnocylindrales bacterium]